MPEEHQTQEASAPTNTAEKTVKKKTILVTGAGGSLAKQTINRLSLKYHVVAVDFRQKVELGLDVVSYKVDFNKRGFEDIFRTHRFDKVLHLGRILMSDTDTFSRYNANVIGTQKMLSLCHKYKVKQVIVLSTFFVYGAHAYNPALLDESAPLKASGLTMKLVDTVELENLANVYMWKHPELNITILRPCRIVGPGMRNSTSLLLASKRAPVLAGFSPMMQYLHVEDMADAICLTLEKNKPGIYNVAPEDWIAYQDALIQCGCKRILLPSVPPVLPRKISSFLGLKAFPSFLINYFKYPVIIDGSKFARTFKFTPKRSLEEIFTYYRDKKKKKKKDLFL